MMYKIATYTVIILLLAQNLSAQEYESDKKFINEVVKLHGKVAYVDCMSVDTFEMGLKYPLTNDTLRGTEYGGYNSEILVLTEDELIHVNIELRRMKYPYLKSGLFDSSIIMSEESVYKILNNESLGWSYFLTYFGTSGYYVFSKPIFLRNDSLCIFYHAQYQKIGGGGNLSVYKKVESIWVPWIDLMTWVN